MTSGHSVDRTSARRRYFGVGAGFGALLALMLFLTGLGLFHLHVSEGRLGTIVNNHMVKIGLATQMYRIARERTVALQKMILLTDPFDRDEQWMQFINFAGEFAGVRGRLLEMGLTPEEREVLDHQGRLTGVAVPLQERVVELSSAGRLGEAQRLLVEQAIPAQDAVLEQLAQLYALQESAADRAVEQASVAYRDARWLLILFSVATIGLGSVIAIAVLRRTARADAGMRKLSSVVEQTADSVVITDRDGRIEYVNPAFEANTGYGRAEAVGHKPNIVKSGVHDESFYRRLWETIRRGEPFREVFVNRRRDGTLYYEEKTITPLKNESGEITHFVSTGKDVTERKQAEDRLSYLAYYDALTGLPNRSLLLDRLRQAMLEAERHERLVAIMILDLDRFKLVNDTLGHEAGDLLLKAVAERLSGCLRRGDTVARLSSDEFAIILSNVARADDVGHVAHKIHNVFARPFQLAGQELFVSPSSGIALYPLDDKDPEALFRNADAAMYHAKQSGRNMFQFFTPELNARTARRLSLETGLRRALARGEFVLHYQPQVDLADGTIIGMEALLRWRREQELVSPLEFIPLAEETGLIVPIGEWALRSACAQNKAWQQAGLPALRVTVNIAARQFQQRNLTGIVAQVLKETGLQPRRLMLEITESTVMQDAEATIETLRKIGGLGVGLSIDDFGTGYSSLGYLKRFPLDCLKIDKSFIDDIVTRPDDAAIVTAIIGMAHTLDLKVVAEGVETPEQLTFLRAQRCDAMQGYYFSKPLPAEQCTELLREGRRLRFGPQRKERLRVSARKA